MKETDVRQGTLALMVLKTLDVLGPLHGYGIARRIERISGDLPTVNQGTLYPLLLRLEQEGSIVADYGVRLDSRRARQARVFVGEARSFSQDPRRGRPTPLSDGNPSARRDRGQPLHLICFAVSINLFCRVSINGGI